MLGKKVCEITHQQKSGSRARTSIAEAHHAGKAGTEHTKIPSKHARLNKNIFHEAVEHHLELGAKLTLRGSTGNLKLRFAVSITSDSWFLTQCFQKSLVI
jgi:ADP-ribosylglycohydrolase